MSNISLKECSDTVDGQKWDVMADGRIALAPSSPRKSRKLRPLPRPDQSRADSRQTEECLDLQFMKASENNPVGLYACAGLANAGAKDRGINWPPVAA